MFVIHQNEPSYNRLIVSDIILTDASIEMNLAGIVASNRMAWQWAETLVEIRGTLADIRGTTK